MIGGVCGKYSPDWRPLFEGGVAMIAVDIITGFLGAGKTTLINKLLAEAYAGELPAIIENEFGDVGIDDSLIENPEIQVKLLASGCICCTLAGGFVEGLAEVAEKYHPTRIIVEPTGLANPADVLAACEEAAKRVPLAVRALVTVVNAENIVPLLAVGGELFHKQIAEAELIVLSCTQLLSTGEIGEATHVIRELNPLAPILEENWTSLDALALLSLAEEARARKSGEACPVCGHIHEHHGHEDENHAGHGHEHGHEPYGYSSLAFFPERTFSREQAEQLLASLPGGACGDILRAKGFLRAAGGGFYRAEYVYGRGELQDTGYNGRPKFVVIGKDLSEPAISELIQ
jgi:G3E family GTPase